MKKFVDRLEPPLAQTGQKSDTVKLVHYNESFASHLAGIMDWVTVCKVTCIKKYFFIPWNFEQETTPSPRAQLSRDVTLSMDYKLGSWMHTWTINLTNPD